MAIANKAESIIMLCPRNIRPRYYPAEMHSLLKAFMRMFISILFVITKDKKILKFPPIVKYIN